MRTKESEYLMVKNKIKYADEISSDDFIRCPLWWHKKGLQQTTSGYGRKLTTVHKIRYHGRFYRVYAICYSNVSSLYIIVNKEKLYIMS